MAQGTPITYQVTNVVPRTEFGPTSQPIPGKMVTYTTSTGYEGSVFIPDSVFGDLNAMRKVIEGEVMAVARAQALTGTVNG